MWVAGLGYICNTILHEHRTFSLEQNALPMKLPLLAGLATSLPLLVQAQGTPVPGEEAPTQITSFVAADFAQYAPRTALDMVSQIPGFRISGDDDARGFGQASENVLINGQRISSKSTNARETLTRIPAANVEKIELLDGASLDIPGLSGQVVDVTVKSSGISGTWTYRQRYRENLRPALDWFEVSVNGEKNDLSWTLGLVSDGGRGIGSGRETITDGTRNLIEYREESSAFIGISVQATGNLTWKPANGSIANLSADYSIFEANHREASNRFNPDDSEFRRTLFQFSSDEWSSEISGDYEFDLGPGRLKLIALQSNDHSPSIARFIGANLDGSNRDESIFNLTVDESESILRGEYGWRTGPKTDWQVSMEGTFNTLESTAALRGLDINGQLAPVDIGDPDIVVEERRGEVFVSHGRQLSPKLRLQLSLGTEVSEIVSDGVNGQTRTFTRPKGSAQTTWEVSDKLTINTTLERRVGQLDFFDFVSNIDLNQGENQAGNVDIVPEQSWRAEIEAQRDYGTWGAVTASVFGEALEDIADQVPIGTGEGPGNLDSATRYGINLDGTLKFDNLGWKGAQVQIIGNYQVSAVDDPLTGQSRRINDDNIHNLRFQFRHDVSNTDWAWGLTYNNFKRAPVFRLNSVSTFEASPAFVWGFVEHKDIFGMTGTVFLGNLTNIDERLTRVFYAPDRTGTRTRIEDRTRNSGLVLTLRLKGSF